MPYHADLVRIKLREERSGGGTLPRSPLTISGAILITLPASSYVAGARNLSIGELVLRDTERNAKVNINESLRGSPMPSLTIVRRLRGAGRCDSASASQCIAGRAGPSISATSASIATRICHPRRRSATTSGDVLQGRCQPRIRLPSEREPSLEDHLSTSTRNSPRATHADDVWCLSVLQPSAWLRDAKK